MLYSYTWQQIARLKAREIHVPSYNEELLKRIANNFTGYIYSDNGIEEIIRDLNRSGVKFFVLSHLSKTYLDGACFFDKEILTFSQPYVTYFSEEKFNSISEQLRISPSVILGVLQHKKLVDYRKLNNYKRKAVELFPEEIVLG